jgi:hypothetical protein
MSWYFYGGGILSAIATNWFHKLFVPDGDATGGLLLVGVGSILYGAYRIIFEEEEEEDERK